MWEMVKVRLNLTPDDDPIAAARWLVDFYAALPEQFRPSTGWVSSDTVLAAVPEFGDSDEVQLDVEGQLGRLLGYWKGRAPYLRQLHFGMVELGYEPRVPVQRSGKRLASYLSYVDPGTGRNLMNANSGTVYIERKDVAQELEGHRFVRGGSKSPVELDGDEKVEFLLDVAMRHKE